MTWVGHNRLRIAPRAHPMVGCTNGSRLSLGRWKGPDLQHELNARLASMAHESALGQTEDPKLVGYTVVQGCPGADGRGRDLQHELNARLASMAHDSEA